jgi:molybdenum-dependent DNA-binding transcriptional regulator ModE
MNLAEFLSRHYGLAFRRRGAEYLCCSPFTGERRPSFFVRLVGGHWLFKDFSSGVGGSIFDFVQMKEKLGSFSEALAFVRKRVGLSVCCMGPGDGVARAAADGGGVSAGERAYDVDGLYDRFRQEDPGVCREYLLGRGIAAELVEGLIHDGTVVHNRYDGRSYCCFAVRDDTGRLRCLDNHAVEGSRKFVLGTKSPFSCEWEAVKRAKLVFLSEGIIDYLSVKSLESAAPPGLAVLGNQLCFDPALLEGAKTLLSAMDNDRGGDSAVLDLKERYPEKQVRLYDLEGHKDPSELLVAVRSGKGRTLSPERKLQLYREFQGAPNKAELSRRWGIDRSHVYEIVRECEQMVVEGFSQRRRGRPAKGKPATLEEALARIEELEAEYERKATEQEEQYCRSEFLAIRLKWAQIEAAELRGEGVDQEEGPQKKSQIKKTRRRRRSKK